MEKITFLGVAAVEKFRVEKKYRAPALDRQIRSGRTKREARLLSRAKVNHDLADPRFFEEIQISF